MPIRGVLTPTKAQQLRAYAKEHRLSYFAAYHLSLSAAQADGVSVSGQHPDVPEFSALSSEDQAVISAAKSALSLT